MSMRVLLDCDGVLADFIGGLCRDLTVRGYPRTEKDITSWELKHSLPAEEQRECLSIMAVPGFCHALAWYEGAREFLAALVHETELHVLTAPFEGSSTWMTERKAWLGAHVSRDRVHFIDGKWKHIVSGDVLVEDHPGNAAKWLDANPGGIAVLIDRPWNSPSAAEWSMHPRMYRVTSFTEALRIIRETVR